MKLLNETIGKIESSSNIWREKAISRIETLTMPHWALGKALDIAVDVVGMTRSMTPPLERRKSLVFGADHGVVEEGVSPMPNAVTMVMMRNFVEKKGAAINVLSNQIGAEVVVVNMGIAMADEISDLIAEGKIIDKSIRRGTANFFKQKAMSRDDAILSIEAGVEVVNSLADTTDIFIIGEMGIGNTTPSSAIISAITGLAPNIVTGKGAGLNDTLRDKKATIIEKALELHKPDINDGLDLLSCVGGFEIGAMAGAMLAAAAINKPIMVDGLICTASALIAQLLAPDVVDYMIAGHKSVEPGHIAAMRHLGKEPLVDLNFRLGEGTGAAIALPIVSSAVAIMRDMSSFDDLGISL